MADEWTDDEINEVILNFFTHSDKTTFQRMKDALSAVKRVPEGYFPALDAGVGKMQDAKDAEIARLTDMCEKLRMEAQCHAMEARAQTATVNEAYQVARGATGKPGNWRGSKPIKDAIDAAFNEDIEAAELRLGNRGFSLPAAIIRELKR